MRERERGGGRDEKWRWGIYDNWMNGIAGVRDKYLHVILACR